MYYKKILEIVKDDQKDRVLIKKSSPNKIRSLSKKIYLKDIKRLESVKKILATDEDKLSKKTLFLAAVILTHGLDFKDQLWVARLAKKSSEMGFKRADNLYKVAIDRFLIFRCGKQKYGTQARILPGGKKEYSHPLDRRLKDPKV